MPLACPTCGSKSIRFAQRKSVWETLLSVIGYCPVRCRDCDHRFREGVLLPVGRYAKCPRCMRTDLTNWEEKYYYPPRWQQALLHFGGKAHRCAVCRYNFVSFLRRQSEFVPSWRIKQQQQAAGASVEKSGVDSIKPDPPQKEQEKTVV